jgi:hypothetical protein
MNEYQSVESLIEGIKGTTGFITGFVHRKFGLVFLFIILGVLVTQLLLK